MEVRSDSGYGHRYMLQNLSYFVPGGGFFVLIVWAIGGERTVWVVVGLIGFVGCVGVGAYMDRYRFRNYRCPGCGRKLAGGEVRGEDREIMFECKDCAVRWDTGLRIPD